MAFGLWRGSLRWFSVRIQFRCDDAAICFNIWHKYGFSFFDGYIQLVHRLNQKIIWKIGFKHPLCFV
jgi:hypothetical protein